MFQDVTEELQRALARGRKNLLFRIRGSAAVSQHLTAEVVGWHLMERAPRPAIALKSFYFFPKAPLSF